ncbi:hypothetical protein [Legionella sp. CNM-4043-24]|uniref:hypothetical protein n=1 Tax=Legionella sp. CNM-4043-24 TaxID=3421646 RepID=UPI00403AA651
MLMISRHGWIIGILLLLALFWSEAAACPCFNERFLYDTFIKNKNIRCFVTTINDKDSSATISNPVSQASSTLSDCRIHTQFQTQAQNLPETSTDQSVCIRVIRRACEMLKVPVQMY